MLLQLLQLLHTIMKDFWSRVIYVRIIVLSGKNNFYISNKVLLRHIIETLFEALNIQRSRILSVGPWNLRHFFAMLNNLASEFRVLLGS